MILASLVYHQQLQPWFPLGCNESNAYLVLHGIFILADKWVTKQPITYFLFRFLRFNFITAEGAYKKFVRLFYTLGSFFGLVAHVLGIFSLLCDQNDIEFELGELKELKDTLEGFYERMKLLVDDLEKNLKALNVHAVNSSVSSLYELMTGIVARIVDLASFPGEG